MVRIKAFENHGSNVCICLEDGGKYWLKKTDLADSCLAVNDEMDTEDFCQFIRIHQYPRALNQAVAMLARGKLQPACSAANIRQKLLIW